MVHGDNNKTYEVKFGIDDFEYVLGCTGRGDYIIAAEDDVFTLGDDGGITSYSSNDDYDILIVEAPGILVNDMTGDSAQLTAVLVSGTKKGQLILNPDGSFTYNPGPKFKGKDGFTYNVLQN